MKRGKTIRSQKDPFGNVVGLTDKSWAHILEHKEMASSSPDEVMKIVAAPGEIKESLLSFPAVRFESKGTTEKIGVLVAYEQLAFHLGNTMGFVSTAYPIDVAHNSAVGEAIWTAEAETAVASEEEEQK